jgi:hypothetical protein
MKILLAIVGLGIALVVGFIVFYRWDSSRNRGYQWGYYGEFNSISNALASIPGVTVTQAWHNLDVTLEEFGFGITVTGQPVRLAFGETDTIREMSRDAAVVALKAQIAAELSTTNK